MLQRRENINETNEAISAKNQKELQGQLMVISFWCTIEFPMVIKLQPESMGHSLGQGTGRLLLVVLAQ